MLKKIFTNIINFMVAMGSSKLQDEGMRKDSRDA